MLRASEARELAELHGAPDWIDDVLKDVNEAIVAACSNGKRSLDCDVTHTVQVVDSYRHMGETDIQAVVLRELFSLGYKAEIIRERVLNTVPGPVKDRCFIRISW